MVVGSLRGIRSIQLCSVPGVKPEAPLLYMVARAPDGEAIETGGLLMSKRTFTNWAGNQRCLPQAISAVQTTGDVARIVGDAHARGSRVKAVGAGHSFTAAAMTDGVLVRLDGLDQLESIDADTGVVMVGAGMRLHDVNLALDEHGRALPNLGDIDVQTIAGATATATHGTGVTLGNLATGIVGFELVTGTGEVLWCDATTNTDVWSAGRVSVGAFGIITKVALETLPAFNLCAVEGPEQLDDLLRDWMSFTASARHAEFFWLPGTNKCFVKRNDISTDAARAHRKRQHFVNQILIENVAFDAAMRVNRRFPNTRDRIGGLLAGSVGSGTRVDKSFRVFASPRHVRFMEMEYGLPIEAVPEALERVRKLIGSMDAPPLFPVEVRVSAADDIPLSTASGRDSGWIAVHQYKGMAYGDYFRGVEAIMDDYEGRPHWGKFHYQTADTLRNRYPRWDEFQSVRAVVDPTGTFRNEYLDRVLGPIGN
jgi:FAD-linked oxidoreductase